jgi:endonuclease III
MNSVDFEKVIIDLGQVDAVNRRAEGYLFSIDDHIGAMILSMLSNQRPWEPIARNMGKLEEIFCKYNHKKLEKTNPHELVYKVKSIQCGNRAINKQMESLKHNIGVFKKIEAQHDSIDMFITKYEPEKVAKILSDFGSPYKLKQIGYPLAMEYLKNVGVIGMKPDVHICRICGPERLKIFSSINNLDKIAESFKKFARDTGYSITYLDNLFWIFGAKNYGYICSSKPNCIESNCQLKEYCNYPKYVNL